MIRCIDVDRIEEARSVYNARYNTSAVITSNSLLRHLNLDNVTHILILAEVLICARIGRFLLARWKAQCPDDSTGLLRTRIW